MKIVARVVLLLALLLPAFAGRTIRGAADAHQVLQPGSAAGLGSGQRPHETAEGTDAVQVLLGQEGP